MKRHPSAGADVGIDAMARLALRLAVLLGAGVAPATAWHHVGGANPPAWVAAVAAAADADPGSIADAMAPASEPVSRRRAGQDAALDAMAVAGLAAMWRVATESGAPLAPALRASAASLRDAAAAGRATRVALAGPRATARVVLVMPVVAVAFGVLLGYDTIGVLLGTPIGWCCTVVGLGLMVLARAWSSRLVARAAVTDPMPGLALDLLAVAVSGGGAVESARALVDTAMERSGAAGSTASATAVIEIATAVGAPIAELLRAEADDVRREAAAAAATRAAALESALMIPLGVCVLPAFVALGVVPLLVAVVSSTVATF